MRASALCLLLALAACSSDDSDSGASSPSTSPSGSASADRSKKISAATDADLPLVCDAWAASVGGYGQPAKTGDCGNAKNTVRPPASQSECVTDLKSQDVASCNASIGAFLDCQAAIYAKPCALVGEAPTCGALFPGPCWH